MAIIKIGTVQRLALNENPKRKAVSITMQSSQIDAANVGQCFVGIGHQPQSVVSDPAAGFPMKQSDAIVMPESGQTLPKRWKRSVWIVCDTADQSFNIDEESEEPTPVPPTI